VVQALADLRVAGIGFAGGQADLSLWTRFLHGEITEGRIELSADALALRGLRPVRLANGEEIEARYSPDATRLSLQWTRDADRERFALLEGPSLSADEPARSKLTLARDRANDDWTLDIAHLELERLMPWLSLSSLASPGTAGWLFEAAPERRFARSAHDRSRRRHRRCPRPARQCRSGVDAAQPACVRHRRQRARGTPTQC
jgi:uncharacterized protein YhdP